MCSTPGSMRKDAQYYVDMQQPTATISLVFLWESSPAKKNLEQKEHGKNASHSKHVNSCDV